MSHRPSIDHRSTTHSCIESIIEKMTRTIDYFPASPFYFYCITYLSSFIASPTKVVFIREGRIRWKGKSRPSKTESVDNGKTRPRVDYMKSTNPSGRSYFSSLGHLSRYILVSDDTLATIATARIHICGFSVSLRCVCVLRSIASSSPLSCHWIRILSNKASEEYTASYKPPFGSEIL